MTAEMKPSHPINPGSDAEFAKAMAWRYHEGVTPEIVKTVGQGTLELTRSPASPDVIAQASSQPPRKPSTSQS